ncbi:MAG TPA: sigma-70 family RNA polymerase sigma factor [Polyangiaceae bacterium]|jgi:RNA polymerase sigma-70 factor (ECF subfamily)
MAANERRRSLRLVRAPNARPEPPDALGALAEAAARGERAAVHTFLVTVGPHLLRVVRRVLGANHPDVDDVAQESAFAVMDALPRHRGESTVLHFACRVAVLTAMTVRRREATRKRHSEREHALEVEEMPSPALAPDAAWSAQASAELVRELLDSLPLAQAEVLALHCVLGYTVPEIAESAGIPPETVRSRLRVAKEALRERVLGEPRLADSAEESS